MNALTPVTDANAHEIVDEARPQITLITKCDTPPLMSKRISLDADGKLKSDGSKCLIFKHDKTTNEILRYAEAIDDYVIWNIEEELNTLTEYLLDRAGLRSFDDTTSLQEIN